MCQNNLGKEVNYNPTCSPSRLDYLFCPSSLWQNPSLPFYQYSSAVITLLADFYPKYLFTKDHPCDFSSEGEGPCNNLLSLFKIQAVWDKLRDW